MTPLELAKTIVSYGWVALPLKGKRPTINKWQTVTRADSLAIVSKAAEEKRADNIGILTGESSGIVVIDIDIRMNGLAKWQALVQANECFNTFTVKTGSGGFHYYFLYDERMRALGNRKIDTYSLDFKTTGGQVVAPGSIHPTTGQTYVVCENGMYPLDPSSPSGRTPKIIRMPKFLFDIISS